MKKNIFFVALISLSMGLFVSSCEHRYYERNQRHSERYEQRHHRHHDEYDNHRGDDHRYNDQH